MSKNLQEILRGTRPLVSQHGANRHRVNTERWQQITGRLGRGLDLVAMWADPVDVHMAVRASDGGALVIVSHKIEDGTFPSVAAHHPAAGLAERMIRDLNGVRGDATPDCRLWLDHGNWPQSAPLAPTPQAAQKVPPYSFLGAEGEGIHQIPVGPVHAGIIEPGHFRFFCVGETVVRLEARLGYTHKGIEKLLEGKTPQDAAPIAARISGDSTVAYALAFARACESATNTDIPERAHWLRALLAELERLSNHCGDIGAICNDAAFALMHAHFGLLREDILHAANLAFGHRLMMDVIVPGGVSHDLDTAGETALRTLFNGLRTRLPDLIDLYDNTPSLQNRTRNTGTLSSKLAAKFGAGGYVGRAAGRAFDARKSMPYPPYDQLDFDVPCLEGGDVNARIWIRIHEIEQSLHLCDAIIGRMGKGDILVPLEQSDTKPHEGVALVEGFRGDIFMWLRLGKDGRIARCHPRDPSQYHWPLLEAVIENNIVADFPICNKSFNCAYSASDL